jgi:MarR family transcriptional regulator, organic hydroperoxide resistance regulator
MADLPQLYHDLVRFETELWNAVDARLRKDCDLTLGRFETLQLIARRTNCRVNDIADALVVTVGGISKVVDRLEESGLCRRRANPDDRRSSIIELTPAGRTTLALATVVFDEELEQRIGSVLSEPALKQLGGALAKLRADHHLTRRIDQ